MMRSMSSNADCDCSIFYGSNHFDVVDEAIKQTFVAINAAAVASVCLKKF